MKNAKFDLSAVSSSQSKFRTLVILSIFFCFSPVFGISQPEQIGTPFIINYHPSVYKEDPQNWSIVQDARNVLYVGNTNGVMEYDGVEWKTIALDKAAYAWGLSADSLGAVYVGSIGEFGKLCVSKTGNVEYTSLVHLLPDSETEVGEVRNVFSTSHGIYFVSDRKIFRLHNDSINILGYGLVNYSAHQIDDRVCVVTPKGILMIGENFEHFLPKTIRFASPQSNTQLIKWNKGSLLVISQEFGLVEYDLYEAQRQYPDSSRLSQPIDSELKKYISVNGLNHAIALPNGNIAVATDAGVLILNKSGKVVNLLNKNRGLLSDYVRYLYVDKAGTLWMATEAGVAKVKLTNPISKLDALNGLAGTVLTYNSHQGKHYSGSFSGLYHIPEYRLQTQNDKFELEKITGIKASVWELRSFSDKLLAATSDGLHVIRNSGIKKVKTHKTYDLTISPKLPNTVFLAQYNGISYFDLRKLNNGTLTSSDIKQLGHIKTLSWNFTLDKYGDIWLASYYAGVYHIRISDKGRFDVQLYTSKDGIPKPYTDLYVEYHNDSIYLGTPDGIYATPIPENKKRASFTPKNHLQYITEGKPLKNVRQIKIKDGRTWVISKQHVGYFTQSKEGYKWHEVPFMSKPAYIHKLILSENTAWLCTNRGLFQYQANKKYSKAYRFDALIRGVHYNGDSIIFNGAFSKNKNESNSCAQLVQHTSEIPEFRGSTDLSFDFSSTAYEKETDTKYRYKLDGFDEKWSDWTKRTHKEYTNLNSGEYTFNVEARDIYGNLGVPAKYTFSIRPPYYWHPVAIIGYLLLGLCVVYLIVRYNTRRLKEANRKLEQIVSERTKEVREQKNEIEQQAATLEATNKELEQLSIVASETHNAVTIMDAEANFEWMNDGFTRLHGYDLNEFTDTFGSNLLESSTSEQIKNDVWQCINNKTSVSYESQNRTREGKTVWTQTTLTPVLNSAGEVEKLVSIDSNISKLKQAEQEIRRQSEELRRTSAELEKTNTELEKLSIVARETDNAVIIMDAEGNFEWVNESFTKMFGYSLQQLIDRKGGNIKNTRRKFIIDAIDTCIKEKKSVQYEFMTHMHTGQEIWVHATITPIVGASGNIEKLIAVDSNITMQKLAEFELKRQSKVIQEQSERVERQNQHITSSIRYAEKIQRANLPIKESLDRYFGSFIIFKPKDIVSGDFYWYSRRYFKQEKVFFVAIVDCTGHGVPGAFMSMIGSRLLSEIVNDRQILETDQILEALHQGVWTTLKQDKTENNDGMDVCLCKIDISNENKIKVCFSGAKRPLFYIEEGETEMKQIKGTRRTIGGIRSKNSEAFEKHTIVLDKGTMLYLTTDGLIDQNSPKRLRFGTPRFLKLLENIHSYDLTKQQTAIENELQSHQGTELQRDDITIMGIKL